MYLIGSKLLGIKNTKDIDYVEIVEGNDIHYRQFKDGKDILYESEDTVLANLNFTASRKEFSIIAYQYDQTLRKHFGHDDFPIKYNILDHRKELEELLAYIKERKILNYNTRLYGKNGHVPKQIFHIAYNKFILLNNSPILTEEQQEFIQRIHDKDVTWDEYIKKVGY